MPDQYFGKYTGIVKDNRDSQMLGQLQVSVPTIFPKDELVAARPALPFGFFFVPDVNVKVWIEFEGGDPGLPLWTGIQYVAGEWPDEAANDPPEKRVVKSAAGHYIIFNDKTTDSGIEIKDGKNNHTIKLNKDAIEVKDGVNQHTIKLSAKGVTIETAAGQKVELTKEITSVDGGSGTVEVKGLLIKLNSTEMLPVIRSTDQGIGNLGAPVPIIGPGNTRVLA